MLSKDIFIAAEKLSAALGHPHEEGHLPAYIKHHDLIEQLIPDPLCPKCGMEMYPIGDTKYSCARGCVKP